MSVRINPQWKILLKETFEDPYFNSLVSFIKEAYQKGRGYPPGKLIFNAFDHCSPEDTRVVLIGQDPYHGQGQANGFCFSVPKGRHIHPH